MAGNQSKYYDEIIDFLEQKKSLLFISKKLGTTVYFLKVFMKKNNINELTMSAQITDEEKALIRKIAGNNTIYNICMEVFGDCTKIQYNRVRGFCEREGIGYYYRKPEELKDNIHRPPTQYSNPDYQNMYL